WAWQEPVQEGVKALVGVFMPFVGEGEGEHGGCEWGMPQGTLDETRVHADFEQMRGVGMPQGRDGHTHVGKAGSPVGGAEGALETGTTQRGGCGWTVALVAPRGGKEPGGIPMGLPRGAEQRQGLGGQGDVPVLGARTAMDMDLEALAVNSGALK